MQAKAVMRTKLLWGPLDGQEVTVAGSPQRMVLPFPVGVAKPRGAIYGRRMVKFEASKPGEGWDVRYVFIGWQMSP